jgi:hypothetical protein
VDELELVGVWRARAVNLTDRGWRLAELEQLVDPGQDVEWLQRLLRAAPLARPQLLQQALAPFQTSPVQRPAALPRLEQQIEGAARAALGNGFGATTAIARPGRSMLAGHGRKLPDWDGSGHACLRTAGSATGAAPRPFRVAVFWVPGWAPVFSWRERDYRVP